MKELDITVVNKILNEIVEYEMAGVVRYAHSSLMISGPFRIPIVQFLQEQASESLTTRCKPVSSSPDSTGTRAKKSRRLRKITTTVSSRYCKKA